DVAATALRTAAQRCGDCAHVRWVHGSVATDVPDETFDLIVLSEVGYYFQADALRRVVRDLRCRFASSVEVVAVHWLGRSADHLLHGDEVHDVLSSELEPELA